MKIHIKNGRLIDPASGTDARQDLFIAAGKIAGIGGDRNLERQMEFIRKGARFLTTNSDIAFMTAEASRVTGELRKALGKA